MGRRRRGAIVVAALAAAAVVVVALVAGPAFAARVLFPRDVPGYEAYVATYLSAREGTDASISTDRTWVEGHRDLVIAEGDRACAWLAAQPDAPGVDPTGRSRSSELTSAYLGSSPRPDVPVSAAGRFYLVTGAWNHLCRYDLHAKTSPAGGGD